MPYSFTLSLCILTQLSLGFLTVYIFRSIWKEDSFLRRISQNILLVCFTLLFTLTLVEITFKLFFIQSDGINFTLASKSWFERYWQPINSLGYRDYEWTPAELAGRTRVAVVGDSFVAGGGIERIEDRFANQLGARLGDEYVVMTIAQNGWSTQQEIEGLLAYPYPPDLVILSYYLNDIEGVAGKMGLARPADLLVYPPAWLRPLVDHSYALNFAYWRLFRWRAFADPRERTDIQSYQSYLRSLYTNPVVWTAHQQELQTVANLTETYQRPLIVVVFPDMLRVEETRDLSGKVVNFFQEQGVPVVDVAALIAGEPPERLVVNSVDSHPSVEVHARVASALDEIIQELEIEDSH